MKNNKKLIMLLVIILIAALMIGSACTPQKRPAPAPNPAPNNNDPGVGDTRMEDRNNNRTNTAQQEKAERLAQKIVRSVDNVNSVTVVFAEEIAYVGIDLYANISGNEAENIKKQVARVVKEDDPDIETVYVTQDADTYTRLQRIARDIEGGRPLSGFLDELQNMFRRITPSMD
ncbi:MAG: YhcN/YlaJ family sporulation lipoprotein [Bacillota bacterium]